MSEKELLTAELSEADLEQVSGGTNIEYPESKAPTVEDKWYTGDTGTTIYNSGDTGANA